MGRLKVNLHDAKACGVLSAATEESRRGGAVFRRKVNLHDAKECGVLHYFGDLAAF